MKPADSLPFCLVHRQALIRYLRCLGMIDERQPMVRGWLWLCLMHDVRWLLLVVLDSVSSCALVYEPSREREDAIHLHKRLPTQVVLFGWLRIRRIHDAT